MTFLGIISTQKDFELIKSEILKSIQNIEVILINKKNIKNLQNVRFEALIVNDEISKNSQFVQSLENLCKNLKYFIINSDKNKYINKFNGNFLHVITYGLNHKCTLTASSISEDNIIIALQRDFLDKYGNLMEMGEIKINKIKNLDVYGNMAIFTAKLMYNKDIKI